MRLFIVFIALTITLSGCTSTHEQRMVKSATDAEQATLLGRVKSLAGTWEGEGPDGTKGTTVFEVSSNGSAVREIMFPGTDHEMTNMYTMDGSELLLTHYCAMGNQPHMRAVAGQSDRIAFRSAGVSNLTSPDQTYMGEMTMIFVDANHIRQEWQSLKNGVPSDHRASFTLTRRK